MTFPATKHPEGLLRCEAFQSTNIHVLIKLKAVMQHLASAPSSAWFITLHLPFALIVNPESKTHCHNRGEIKILSDSCRVLEKLSQVWQTRTSENITRHRRIYFKNNAWVKFHIFHLFVSIRSSLFELFNNLLICFCFVSSVFVFLFWLI